MPTGNRVPIIGWVVARGFEGSISITQSLRNAEPWSSTLIVAMPPKINSSSINSSLAKTRSIRRLGERFLGRACRIKHVIERGGYRNPESEWPEIHAEMVETMTKLEAVLKPAMESLGL